MINGKITGFELLPKGQGVKVLFTDNVEEQGGLTYKEYDLKVERVPSDKLMNVFRALKAHPIYYCGWHHGKLTDKELKARKIVDMPEFKDYSIRGFKIVGDGEDEKILFKIAKRCAGEEIININAPKIDIVGGEYVYEDILAADLEQIIEEIKLYIEGKNYYIQAQIEFPEPVDAEEVEEEL